MEKIVIELDDEDNKIIMQDMYNYCKDLPDNRKLVIDTYITHLELIGKDIVLNGYYIEYEKVYGDILYTKLDEDKLNKNFSVDIRQFQDEYLKVIKKSIRKIKLRKWNLH